MTPSTREPGAATVEEITVPMPDGPPRRAILGAPERDQPCPGVVVVHDVVGFAPDLARQCRRFAEAGYAALAPDLYRGGSPRCVVSTVLGMVRGGGPALEVVAAARRALVARPEVDPARVAITGFCMGGGFALLAAADGAYAVAAPFYGAVPREAERLRGICPTIAQYGARDRAFLSHARRLEQHLETLGVPHEVLVYEDAGHAFMNRHGRLFSAFGPFTPLRSAYHAPTEAKAWEAMLAFFERHMPSA